MAPFPNFQNESMSTRVKRYPCSTAQDAKLKAKNKDSKASGWLWSFGGMETCRYKDNFPPGKVLQMIFRRLIPKALRISKDRTQGAQATPGEGRTESNS